MKIVLIGQYPPPYGGVSIHIRRSHQLLLKNEVESVVCDTSKLPGPKVAGVKTISSYMMFLLKVPFIKADLLHFHIHDRRARLLLGFYALLGKTIVHTIHGDSLRKQLARSNWFIRRLLIWSMKRLKLIICVNQKIKHSLLDAGISEHKLAVVPAYIHPSEELGASKGIPESVWRFVDQAGFLIVANGWIKFDDSGNDLYGLDMLINAIVFLKKREVDAHLLFSLLGTPLRTDSHISYLSEIERVIKEHGLQDRVLLFKVQDSEFCPLLKEADLFVRPTTTDGDALSLREALCLNVPSIASNCCKRPKGALLFEPRDQLALNHQILNVIEYHQMYRQQVLEADKVDYSKELLQIYTELFN